MKTVWMKWNEAMEDTDQAEGIFDGEEEVWQIMSIVAPKTSLKYCLQIPSFSMYLLMIQNEIETDELFEPWFLDI